MNTSTEILMIIVFVVYIVLETRLGSAGRRNIDLKFVELWGRSSFRLHVNHRLSHARHNTEYQGTKSH